ncbi:MAG: S46 family peptidase, partial [Dysgonamonadaceae bacterium]|nr:S46 family peptidase [Dysgonamonadaceae bacterium]
MKKITCLFLGLMLTVSLFADEGMWMLNNLNPDNWAKMRSLGFVMPERQLYNPDGVSLKDAVVHFNGGCTGITVSDLGLIFTNHHCGYGAIQSQSTVEHDYLKDGFVAQTLKDEIPIPGMYVRYLLRTEDFTGQILSQLEGIKDEAARLKKINEICTIVEDSVSGENKFIEAHISSY